MTDITCPSCNGAKKLLSLGLQYADCWNCGGKGFVVEKEPEAEIKAIEIKKPNTFTLGEILIPKKKGRPKRIVNA